MRLRRADDVPDRQTRGAWEERRHDSRNGMWDRKVAIRHKLIGVAW